jgi:5-methylcytosine-specific restriction enzyme subunit McrC
VESAAATEPARGAAAGDGPRIYGVREYGYVDVPLTDLLEGNRLQVDPDVQKRGFFTLQLRGDRLQLQARGYVGLIPLNERVAIDVRPRVSVGNFTRILELAGYTPEVLTTASRRYAVDPEWSDSLLDLYARALVDQLGEIELRGMFREYERREEATSFPRGRILVGRTATVLAPRGKAHVAASSWFERTADTPVNRCIKYAIWFLGQRYARTGSVGAESRRIHRALSARYGLFDGVALDHQRRFLDDPQVDGRRRLPTLRAYYRPALEIALAIIRGHAIRVDRPGHALTLPSLILKMEEVFEDYLRSVLRHSAADGDWHVRILDGRGKPPGGGRKLLFDHPPSNDATPDIVLQSEPLSDYPAILEVKYKPANGDPARDDLNQAITYAVSYRSDEVVLVQPRAPLPSFSGLRTLGTIADATVYQYVFDLNAADLDAEEALFSHAIRDLAGLPSSAPRDP